MNLSFFLAKRLYSVENKSPKASLPAIKIAITGVATGLAVMLLAVAIALGFKKEISSKVIGFGSHIVIMDASSSLDETTVPVNATPEFVNSIKKNDNVKHVQSFSLKPGILKTEKEFTGISLKGIGKDYDTSFIKAHIIEGRLPDFTKQSTENEIVISHNVANTLKLKCGDKVYAYFFKDGLRTRRLKIAAVYRTDLSMFDEVFVYASRQMVNKLNDFSGMQASGIEVSLNDYGQLYGTSLKIGKEVAYHNIENNTQYVSYNIKELYPQIFDWLGLLDINIAVILILMILVAGVTIVSGLLILILERTGTIALLKSLGATNALIRHTFIKLAVIILLKGIVIGNIIGLSLAFLQAHFHIVRLDPASYYIDSVPVVFNPVAIIAINICTFIISTLALVLPSYFVSRVHPSKVLRFE